MKRVISFVLLANISLICISQNLIINPGFESWTRVNKPNGWTHAENCLKDSIVFSSGKYACMHTGGATATSDLGQTMTVSPGKKYSLSLYYRTSITSTGNGVRIWCYWKDASGNSLSDPLTDDILRPSKYMKSGTWQQFSVNMTSPPEAVAFYLEVRTYPNSTVYWDDFVFEEAVATGDNENIWLLPYIYPVPASNYLFVRNIPDLQRIEILSIKGNTVWSAEFSGESGATIPVDGFTPGMYIIIIRSSDKDITRKFIKK
jgi:hypothetical protein